MFRHSNSIRSHHLTRMSNCGASATRARARFLALKGPEQERCLQLLQQDFLFVSTKAEDGIQISLERQDGDDFKNQTFLAEKQSRQLQVRRDSQDLRERRQRKFSVGTWRFQTTYEPAWLVCLFFVFPPLWHHLFSSQEKTEENWSSRWEQTGVSQEIELWQLENKNDNESFQLGHFFLRFQTTCESTWLVCLFFVFSQLWHDSLSS